MLLIPAIDIKEGRCVRLRQGRMDDETVFSDDPVSMAKKWYDQGAERLHIVDLDGAVTGKPKNAQVIAKIVAALPDFPIQVGGGVRDEDTIGDYLDAGVSYVILGSKAVRDPHFVNDMCLQFSGHIYAGLDVRDGKVAIQGWSQLSQYDAPTLAKRLEKDGVEAIIYTDISKDGMMQGVNVEATVALARELHIPVIASGGVSRMEDIQALTDVADEGISGAIIGRALYEGSIQLSEAIEWVETHSKGR